MKIYRAAIAVFLLIGACRAGDATGRSYFQPRLPWAEQTLLLADVYQRLVDEDGRSCSHFTVGSTVMYQASTSDKDFARYFLPGGKNDLVVKGANAGGDAPDISATWLQIVGDNTGGALTVNQNDTFDGSTNNATLWLNRYASVISLKPSFERTSAAVQMRYNNKIGRMPWSLSFTLPFAQMRTRAGLQEKAIEHAFVPTEDVPPLIALDSVGGDRVRLEFMQSPYSRSAIEAFNNPNKHFGKMSNGVLDATGLGDMSIDFTLDPCSFLTLGVRGELPTSKKGTAAYLFEPLVGKNGHTSLGAYAILYKDLFERHDFLFNVRGFGNYEAQLPANELRTLDLQDAGPWSRYLLLLDADHDLHNGQPGVNFLTKKVHVDVLQNMTVGLAAEAKYKAFSASLGYSLFMRAQEKLSLRDSLPEKLFIAGQFASVTGATFTPESVHAGEKNVHISNHIKIAEDGSGDPAQQATASLALKSSDLDLQSASMPAYISQQITASVGYTGKVHGHYLQLTAGGSYEMLSRGSSYDVYSLFGAVGLKL